MDGATMTASSATLRFRLLGIPVAVQPSFWVVAVLLGLGGERSAAALAVWVAILFVSVLGHELGHAAAFRAYGHRPSIRLVAMGGETSPEGPRAISHGRDIVITLAGPAVGIVAGAVLLALDLGGGRSTLAEVAVAYALWANLGLSVLNLVPVLPLDGGRVMRAGLQLATRDRGEGAALVVSVGVAMLAAALAATQGLWWIALFAAFFALVNVHSLIERHNQGPRRDPAELVEEGYAALEKGATLAAGNRAREALAGKPDPDLYWAAAQLLVWTALVEDDLEAAAGYMARLPLDRRALLTEAVVAGAGGHTAAVERLRRAFVALPGEATAAYLVTALLELDRLDDAVAVLKMPEARSLGPDAAALVGAVLFRAGRFADAARLGEQVFSRFPHPALAYNVACCWARQGRPQDALVWLGRAVDAGYDSELELEADADLVEVRAMPGYGELRRRLSPVAPERP